MSLPADFVSAVNQLIPAQRRFDDPLSTLAFGTDASFYRLIPKLVAVEFGGSLKAEHGTGRNMAPFVELEWGPMPTN